MFKNKMIISCVLAAMCVHIALPAAAGYTTYYIPNNITYPNGVSGQTIIVRGEVPTQTVMVNNTIPNTVVVQETIAEPTYIPQTAYVSNESLVAAGFTGLVGGVLLGSLFHHHKNKPVIKAAPHHYQPPRPAHKPNKGGKHGGRR